MGIFLKYFSSLKNLHQESRLYIVERNLMALLGFWPLNKVIRWKVLFIFLLDFLMNTIPSVKFMLDALITGDSRSFALVVPEVLLNIHYLITILAFLSKIGLMRSFLLKFESEWHKDDDDEWQQIRSKAAKYGNRVSIWSNVLMHFTGLFYFFVPQLIFVTKYYILKIAFKEKPTVLQVE